MKIRKQVQKQALEGPALLQEPGDQKLSRQISGETAQGGRLSAGKSVIGDSSLTRGKRVGALTTSSATSQEGGAAGGHDLQPGPTLEVHVAAPVDQTPLQESLEESYSETCGDWTLHLDHHNNARRKYARRSLRSAGSVPDALMVQPQINGSSNRQPVVAKVIRRSTHPSRREARCVGKKFPIGHPGGETEGSLLHCLYLQLLAAGSEGMTLKEIFASFASQTEFSRLDCDWKIVLKSELKRNPYFQLVKARYFLDEREPQTPLSAPKAAKEIRSLMDLNVEPRSSRSSIVSRDAKSRQVRQCDTTLSTSPDPSVVVNNEGEVAGVQTRRKTYERTIEAVLNESAVEFQKTQKVAQEIPGDNRSTEELSTTSRRSSGLHMAAPTIATPPECATIGRPSKKRKSPVVGIHGADIPEPMDFRHTGAVPGSLKAMQARIVAETGVQNGARCSRKDGSNVHSKWQCPMMAMEGRSLCQHHNFLSERKKARYKKARRQAAAGKKSPPPSPPPREKEREVGEEDEKDSEEKGGSSRKGPMVTQLQDLNKPPRDCMEEEEEEVEVHKQVEEVAAPPGDATMRTRSSNAQANGGDGIMRTRSGDALANGSPAESANNAQITTVEVDSETEGGHAALAKSKSVNAPSSVAEVGRQPFRSTRKPRMYLAAKKTAEKTSVVAPAPGKSVKKQSVPLIRPPSIPPLPMLYGVRRKSMKNRPSQASLSSL